MADEILGNCYELITEIAIADYCKVLAKGERVFTQETPVGIGIVPDILIGKKLEEPRILLQVHHTRAERASEKKFWRNVGEYVDARNALGPNTLIVTVAFDSGQKRKLSAAATHLMDGFIEVDRQSYGPELLKFAKSLEAEIKIKRVKEEDRLALTRTNLKSSKATVLAIRAFAADLNSALATASAAGASWFAEYARIQTSRLGSGLSCRVPTRKLTTLRRGLGRFLPVDDQPLLLKLLASVRTEGVAAWPKYMASVGIVSKSIGGSKFKSPCLPGSTVPRKMEADPAYEVYRMTEVFDDATLVRLWAKLRGITTSLKQACSTIREIDDFKLYHKFVLDNYDILTTAAGMKRALKDCFDDPDVVLGTSIGLSKPGEKGVWLFDYIMTVIKAKTGKQQGYGYTQLGEDAGFRFEVAATGGVVISPFIQRRKALGAGLMSGVSKALAKRLGRVSKAWLTTKQAEISRFALTGQFEDKIYKTASFDPILEEILFHLPAGSLTRSKRTPTFLTGHIGKGAATCDTLQIGDTLIMWQSASAQGDDHKTKELCGRIGMLRVTTDSSGRSHPASFKRAVLVVDGTWQQDQLGRLGVAGFDAIYYVDEIDKLARDLKALASGATSSVRKTRRR
jgi:hypothetical protein